MSIKGEIEKTASYLRSARKAILGRGGEISTTAGLKDFPSAIYNIPADTSLAFITDDAVSYRKVVPENASPYARVDRVGGMSYKTKNLLHFPYNVIGGVGASKVNAGITCSIEEDRAVMFNGTCTSTAIHFDIAKITLKSGTYNLSIGDYKGSNSTIQFALYNTANSQALASDVYFGNATNRTFTVVNEGEILIRAHIYKVTLNNVRFYLMLNEGSTALPYEPFFEGIRSAKVTELVSEGANKFNPNAEPSIFSRAKLEVLNGNSWRVISEISGAYTPQVRSAPIPILGNTLYVKTKIKPFGKVTNGQITASLRDKNGTKIVDICKVAINRGTVIGEDEYANFGSIGQYPNAAYIDFVLYANMGEEACDIGDGVEYSNIMVSFDADMPYAPYVGTIATKPIPEALRNFLEQYGYGLGIDATYNNHIDYERKIFVQNVIKVTLDGSADEKWYMSDIIPSRFRLSTPPTENRIIKCICNHYDHNTTVTSDSAKTNGILVVESGYLWVRDMAIVTLDDFKAQLATWHAEGNPLTVIYALAEPIEIDISAYLTGDSFIEVQAGGTITAVNEYEYAVPSEFNYIQRVGG